MIEVKLTDVHPYINRDEAESYIEMFNGIMHEGFKGGKYVEGNRNNLAVDFCCICFALGLDPVDTLKIFVPNMNSSDMIDFIKRAANIKVYLNEWSKSDLTDFMFDPFVHQSNSFKAKEAGIEYVKLI